MKIKNKNLFLIIISVFLQVSVVFFSGLKTKQGLVFQPQVFHDSLWHLALIQRIKAKGFFINYPNFSSVVLKNYHYLWNFIVGFLNKIFQFDILTFYFRIIPLLLSFSFAIIFYFCVQRLYHSQEVCFWSLFFCLLGGSFAFFIPFFLGFEKKWHQASFWVSQTFSNLINPHLFVSLIVFFIITWLLLKYFEQDNYYYLFAILFFNIIHPFIKTYGALVVLVGLGVLALKRILGKREYALAIVVVLTILFNYAFISLLNFENRFPFIFYPGWFLRVMVEASDRVNFPWLALRENFYIRNNNYLGVFLIRIFEFFIFLIGNLGTRIIGFFSLITFFKNKKLTDINLFLLTILCFSIFFPHLFIQKGVVWNTIQFWYYVLPIMSIYAGKAMVSLLHSYQLKKKIILSTLIIFLTIPTSIKTVLEQNKGEQRLISNELLQALSFIKKNTDENDVLVVERKGILYKTSLAAFFSEREVFLANICQLKITFADYQEREKALKQVEQKEDFSGVKRIEPRAELFLREKFDKMEDG